jgi:hypothetical protein
MMQVPYEAVLVSYVQREWENGHKKMVTGRGNILKNKGNERTGIRE